MSEHVFRDAPGFGGETSEYERENNLDHYGTLHEEIVRCRDCRHAVDNEWFGYLQCNRPPDEDGGCLRVPTEPDGFCKWGERKE